MIAAALALLLAGTPASIGVGIEARDGSGDVDGRTFVYPNTGFTYGGEKVYLEANSPLPILIPDLFGAVVVFLAGGDRIPLWYAFNGDREPVAVRFMDGTARWCFPLADVAAVEAGVTTGFFIGSVYAGDERISVDPWILGPSLAFRTGTEETVVVRFALQGGNARTHHAAVNPWFGATARSSMAIGEKLVFELRGDWSRTRLDLRSYRTSTGAQVAGKEVLDVYGGELRLGWRL